MIKKLTLNNLDDITNLERKYGFLSFQQLHNNIQSPNYICLGWFKEQILCAYLIANKTIDSIDIVHLLVISSFRRQHVATKLINELIRQNNNHHIHIEVALDNYVAINMYKKIGFEQIYIRKNYYGQNKDAIYMVLK